MKTNPGRFFEDYTLGEIIHHAVPRTLEGGEKALYHAVYPARHALMSSAEFARSCGLMGAPFDEFLVFHTVFGKTVPDISLNAVANLGYAEGRWLKPVLPGATLTAKSEVIGLKQNSNGKTGIVWVRTTGSDQSGEAVLDYVRWVMVRKGNVEAPVPEATVPDLKPALQPEDLSIPQGLDFSSYNFQLAGEPHRFGDYEIGEKMDHVDRVTVEEAEHMMATRLWQNTAKVHFDATYREDGKRLIYGGHVISLARSLSFNGLANAQMVVGLNGGSHVSPLFAGDTVCAWSEVLDKADVSVPGVGALRLRLVAHKPEVDAFALKRADGSYEAGVLLDLDYWVLVPT
ncbi:MAG: MaoC family dehydratase [Pseudomonadota bacterium]